jgi:putative ABC transport system permease protein
VSARRIRVIAFNPSDNVLEIPEVQRKLEDLKEDATALFDERSDSDYGHFAAGQSSILARRPIHIVGTFRLGTDLANDGNLIMSDRNFLRYFPDLRLRDPALRLVEVGLLRLKPEADVERVRQALQAALGPQWLSVLTKDEYVAKERAFWNRKTPIGTVFNVGALLGLIVGAVICYQVLSSDIADHLAEYATLKAIGYGNTFLIGVVITEALILSFAGFLPGVAVGSLLYGLLAWSTGLLMVLSPARAGLILGLTVLMCLGSGLLAIRKLLAADPAGLF